MNSWENAPRRIAHGRDAELERVLAELNDRLRAGKPRTDSACTGAPLLFVLGCARSGSTLLMQWLSSSGVFACPTNIVSRFPGDPTVGALVHRALYELDHRGEIFPDHPATSSFRSTLGRAQGAAEPHDFGYLWTTRFRFGATQDVFEEEPTAQVLREFVADVRGMQEVFGRPLAMKAVHFNWHIGLLAELFPECIMLHIHRDPLDNARSLLGARREYFGDEAAWYSFKPPEFAAIAALPPWEQCVAQAVVTDNAVRTALKALPAHRRFDLAYDDLCAQPAAVWERLMTQLGHSAAYTGPSSFEARPHDHDAALRARAGAILGQFGEGS